LESAFCQPSSAGGGTVSPASGFAATPIRHGVWRLYDYPVVSSTNLVAADLTPWTAVRARTQTAGRGRFQRNWVSDEGGLWLSAVLPVATPASARVLPLLAGVALYEVIQSLGVSDSRLRWPNDLLAGDRKLAGILLDMFHAESAVLGIGINVNNQPEARDTSLRNQTARLADLVPNPPELHRLTTLLLDRIASEWNTFLTGHCLLPLDRLNRCWGPPRQVELDLDGSLFRGTFTGVDGQGRLALLNPDGSLTFYAAHQVCHLTEIES
jgi:BirA family transcriptional regulator, biotin operon repressor / biotin---[acetyl-CoA-carboxylase] ligase